MASVFRPVQRPVRPDDQPKRIVEGRVIRNIAPCGHALDAGSGYRDDSARRRLRLKEWGSHGRRCDPHKLSTRLLSLHRRIFYTNLGKIE